jgi:hypothetical protein
MEQDPRTRWTWDFALMVATLALLGGLGAQSLVGTGYVFFAQRADADWMRTGYGGYVEAMNAIALPQVVALVAVMGLCVPKRLFERRRLAIASGLLLAGGLAAWAIGGDGQLALGIYLGLAALIQLAVVVLTIAGAGSLRFVREGRLVRVGSGLLHMGLLVFGIVVLALREKPAAMMPAFAVSALLILGGSSLAFWAVGRKGAAAPG